MHALNPLAGSGVGATAGRPQRGRHRYSACDCGPLVGAEVPRTMPNGTLSTEPLALASKLLLS